MTTTVAKVLEDALRLPENERADLVARLIDSLDPGEGEDVQAAWQAEVQRRLSALDNGIGKLIPWSEAHRMIFTSLSF